MSDDLIERLRREPRIEPFSNQGEPDYRPSMEHRAADEIEYLRAENARLRDALEKIANYLPMFDYVVNDGYGKPDISKPGSPFDRGRAQEAEHLSSIARAALQTEGDE